MGKTVGENKRTEKETRLRLTRPHNNPSVRNRNHLAPSHNNQSEGFLTVVPTNPSPAVGVSFANRPYYTDKNGV